ncbi:MAG: phytanoyl-CoA dioxygenase family protein [Caldilineaceae bacterium]|nr:phytanoyl-CoA dioxygenase family protein [Caldilineaceae bacterium]MCB0138506.1 phytanoyl-CoA dioxygenase family protein [Caldilineaceae bacterium]
MLTQPQKDKFEREGLIRLDGFLPQDKVAAAQEFIFRLAEKEGLWHKGVWQVEQMPNRPLFTKPMTKAELNILMTPELLAAIDILVDGRAVEDAALKQPSLLFTPPQETEWTVPANVWHLDIPRLPIAGLLGVQVFTFLDTVIPRGGGTLVVTGSHRLLNSTGKYIRSQDVKKLLKKEAYFRDLMSKNMPNRQRFLTIPGKVGDVELCVVELHGEPGDVFLMDLRMLHTLSPNTASIPRLMVTERYRLKSAVSQLSAWHKAR